MTGTPSGTATAYDNGKTRCSIVVGAFLHEPTATAVRVCGEEVECNAPV
jgi:hypothetical protein